MPADLSSYIADRYLVADAKPTKKRKRKRDAAANSGLLITDDDDSSWTQKPPGDGDDDVSSAAAVAGTSAEFRKTKTSNWKTIAGASTSSAARDDDAAAADAILSAAAAETEAARAADDAAPVVEGGDGDAGVVKMADGTHAGLQTAASVTAQLEKRRREERVQYEAERRARGLRDADGEAAETVYRDATGRRIDVAMRREDARRRQAEAEDKARAAKEALRGDVQVDEARRRREMLEDAALLPLARRADDEEMNRGMKDQARWNDPMAQFLTKNTAGGGGGGGGAGKAAAAKGSSGRPVYAGPAAPNRYGIRPGYRWDGVDRGNGFEAERFKAINRRERNKNLEYAWQEDE